MQVNENSPRSWLSIWAPPIALLALAIFGLYETGVLADTPGGERPTNWHEVDQLPKNLCGPGEGAGARQNGMIFRGARPNDEGLMFLQAQGVAHVMDLEMPDVQSQEEDLIKQLGLGIQELPHPMNNGMGVNKLSDGEYDNEGMIEAVAELRRPENFPIYVHCHYGDDRTGLVIALSRVFNDCWAPKDAEKEWNHIEGWVHHLFQIPKHTYFHKVMKDPALRQYFKDRLNQLVPNTAPAESEPKIDEPVSATAQPAPMQEPGGVRGSSEQ